MTTILSKFSSEDIVIKTNIGLSLPQIISNFKVDLTSQINLILNFYIKLISEIDFDNIIKGFALIITIFKTEIIESSLELTKIMVDNFERCLKVEDIETGELEPEALQAAESIIEIFTILLDVSCEYLIKSGKNTYFDILRLIFPIINYTLSNKVASLFTETIFLLNDTLNNDAPLMIELWKLFPLICNNIIEIEEDGVEKEGFGYEYKQELISSMIMFIIKDSDHFFHSNLLNYTINIFIPNLIIYSERVVDHTCFLLAIKLIITIGESFQGHLNEYIPNIINDLVKILNINNVPLAGRNLILQAVYYI